MRYSSVEPAVFLERLNRFTARIEKDGQTVYCHVKNTGRCRELLVPGVPIYVEHCPSPSRKTAYDLITVCKGSRLVNLDSQAPNAAVLEWLPDSGLFGPDTRIRSEYTWGDSRFDFMAEGPDGKRCLLEVKGATLEENGVARFPDAPTLRGVKHIEGLIRALSEGLDACLLFVIQMKGVQELRPHDQTHPEFGEALRRASLAGVRILAYDCLVRPDSLLLDQPIPVRL